MPSGTSFEQPAFKKVLLSLVVGISLGLAIGAPAIGNDVSLDALGEPGPVGTGLVIAVLAITVLTTSLFALYQFFLLVDR